VTLDLGLNKTPILATFLRKYNLRGLEGFKSLRKPMSKKVGK